MLPRRQGQPRSSLTNPTPRRLGYPKCQPMRVIHPAVWRKKAVDLLPNGESTHASPRLLRFLICIFMYNKTPIPKVQILYTLTPIDAMPTQFGTEMHSFPELAEDDRKNQQDKYRDDCDCNNSVRSHPVPFTLAHCPPSNSKRPPRSILLNQHGRDTCANRGYS